MKKAKVHYMGAEGKDWYGVCELDNPFDTSNRWDEVTCRRCLIFGGQTIKASTCTHTTEMTECGDCREMLAMVNPDDLARDSNLLWKRRYENLKQFMADAEFDIRKEEFTACQNRAWDAPEVIYVSFGMDTCDSEEHAIKNFGKGKYDVYRLERKGDES